MSRRAEEIELNQRRIAEKLEVENQCFEKFPNGMQLLYRMSKGLLTAVYTDTHLLNDLFMLSIQESNEVFYLALLKLNAREPFLDLSNPKIIATARKTQNPERVRELIEYGFKDSQDPQRKAEQSVDEGKKESVVEDQDRTEEPSLLHQFNNKVKELAAQIQQKLNQKNGQKQLAHQWKAFPRCPTVDKESVDKFLTYMSSPDDFKSQLSLSELPAEVNQAIENLVIYGAKLWEDLAKPEYDRFLKHNQLMAKINSLSVMLRQVLSQETLTPASIQDAYTAFQEKDVNRGTDFFLVHSFFAGIGIQNKKVVFGKTYTDKDGAKNLIKSTSGELVYELYRALQKHAVRVDDDVDEYMDHESQQSVSQS